MGTDTLQVPVNYVAGMEVTEAPRDVAYLKWGR